MPADKPDHLDHLVDLLRRGALSRLHVAVDVFADGSPRYEVDIAANASGTTQVAAAPSLSMAAERCLAQLASEAGHLEEAAAQRSTQATAIRALL